MNTFYQKKKVKRHATLNRQIRPCDSVKSRQIRKTLDRYPKRVLRWTIEIITSGESVWFRNVNHSNWVYSETCVHQSQNSDCLQDDNDDEICRHKHSDKHISHRQIPRIFIAQGNVHRMLVKYEYCDRTKGIVKIKITILSG